MKEGRSNCRKGQDRKGFKRRRKETRKEDKVETKIKKINQRYKIIEKIKKERNNANKESRELQRGKRKIRER